MSNLNLGLIYKQINQLSSLNHSKVDRKTTRYFSNKVLAEVMILRQWMLSCLSTFYND